MLLSETISTFTRFIAHLKTDYIALLDRESFLALQAAHTFQHTWSSLEAGIDLFHWLLPKHYPTVIVDEVTFVVPTAIDSESIKQVKLTMWNKILASAMYHGHSPKSPASIWLASSTPEFFRKLTFGMIASCFTL